MAKPKITRTYGTIHFEDLDPHRFEDLIRELIYDFKDWQSIEATGKSGNDGGFDVRAYEKVSLPEPEEEDVKQEIHPMEGNLWMIQGKREKELGPKRVKDILAEIDIKNPPYGYILAASANFSKDSYDIFRQELRKKGVMEFHLWGKGELEDMLHMPKNDRILFTFFGISLVTQRRTRTTEVRSVVTKKNKLFSAFEGSHDRINRPILIRALRDANYPFEGEYEDFKKNPKWKEYDARRFHPTGIRIRSHQYYAYVDTEKKEWDFTKEAELRHQTVETDEARAKGHANRDKVMTVWEFLPQKNQGSFIVDKLLKYEDISVIDDKGDSLYPFPHLYVDFEKEEDIFKGSWYRFNVGEEKIALDDSWKRIEIFPKKFTKPKKGKIYKEAIAIKPEAIKEFHEHYERVLILFDLDGQYSFLKPRDIVSIGKISPGDTEDQFVQITHQYIIKIKDYLEKQSMTMGARRRLELQIGSIIDENQTINVTESKRISTWAFEKK